MKPPGSDRALTSSESTTLNLSGPVGSEARASFCPKPVDVIENRRVGYELNLLIQLRGQFPAEGEGILNGRNADLSPVDVTDTDVVDIGIPKILPSEADRRGHHADKDQDCCNTDGHGKRQ